MACKREQRALGRWYAGHRLESRPQNYLILCSYTSRLSRVLAVKEQMQITHSG
jgi:hypothetical protein